MYLWDNYIITNAGLCKISLSAKERSVMWNPTILLIWLIHFLIVPICIKQHLAAKATVVGTVQPKKYYRIFLYCVIDICHCRMFPFCVKPILYIVAISFGSYLLDCTLTVNHKVGVNSLIGVHLNLEFESN